MIVLRINWNIRLTGPAAQEDLRRDPAWQQKRWELFGRFTLPGLQRQTQPDWRAWLICDRALSDLTDPMLQALPDARVKLVYDLPAAVRALAATAPQHIVYLRLDSDDLLHPWALARLCGESPGLVQFGAGYALHHPSGRLYEWNHPSPPFIARVGDYRILTAGLPDLGGDHMRVHRTARRLEDRRWYIVTIHGGNLCNRVQSRWVGRELSAAEAAATKLEFAIEGSDRSVRSDRSDRSDRSVGSIGASRHVR